MIALSPASWPVECAGARHRLSWRDGELLTADHPEPERELALSALGGESYRCLQLAQAWQRHADDLDVLLLASRGPHDRLDGPDDEHPHPLAHHGRPRAGASFGRYAYSPLTSSSPASPPATDPVDLQDVLGLGGGLPDRLVAQVVDAWRGRLADGQVGTALPRLQAALYGRFAAVARHWLDDSQLRIDLTLASAGSAPSLQRSGDALQVRLPFDWLARVWLAGFATVADRLCLDAAPVTPGRYELTLLSRDLTTQSCAVLDLDHQEATP